MKNTTSIFIIILASSYTFFCFWEYPLCEKWRIFICETCFVPKCLNTYEKTKYTFPSSWSNLVHGGRAAKISKQQKRLENFRIFESHLFYSCLVWAQNINSIKRLYILQKKSLRLMYFLNRNTHTTPLFKDSNILKFPDKIALENCIFIKNYFNQTLPTPFKNWFTLSTDSHTHNTRWSNLGCLKILPHKTKMEDNLLTLVQSILGIIYKVITKILCFISFL